MSVKPLKRTYDKVKSIEEWRVIIARYQASGLGQKQFCEREGIGYGRFKAWLYRLKALDKHNGGDSSPLFTPLIIAQEVANPAAPEPDESPLILELCGEMRIVVRSGFGSETLKRLISVVRGLHV
jgi:hypothetical protein